MGQIHQCCSVCLVCVLRNVLLVCPINVLSKNSCVFFSPSFAINNVNKFIRRTRAILMISSGFLGIMKRVGGFVVVYEFKRSALTIITASYFG